MPHQSGNPDWSGGNPGLNPGTGGGGKPAGAGTKKGALFGDQIVLYRDLDPTDGGGNGEPILDPYGGSQLIAVGYDPGDLVRPEGDKLDDLFPIYMEEIEEGDYEFPAALVPYLQEVELERANVSRAPAKVTEKALVAALEKVEGAYDAYQADTDPQAELEDYLTTDPAGRIMYRADIASDFATIDAPLENLAVFQALMTAGGATGWPEAYDNWATPIVIKNESYDISVFRDLVGTSTVTPDWDPSALLGAAWSKEGLITLDAMLYENTTLRLNTVDEATQTVTDYFDFVDDMATGTTADDTESYDYSRAARYGGDPEDATWLRWTIDVDGTPEYVYATVYDAVFGGGDPMTGDVLPGQDWVDQYLFIDFDAAPYEPEDDMFTYVSADNAGVNDFAQAADDSRAVIEFIHTYGAVVVAYDDVPDA